MMKPDSYSIRLAAAEPLTPGAPRMKSGTTRVLFATTCMVLFTAGCDSADPGEDAGAMGSDAGVETPDAGLAAEGEPCVVASDCESGLECISSLCAAVGGEGQPCRSDSSCDADLGCIADTCAPVIQARFCHCIFASGGASPQNLEIQVGDAVVGPTPSDVCTACTDIPIGNMPYEIRVDDGRVLESGTLDVTSDNPVLGLLFSISGLQVVAGNCESAGTGFCGP